MGIPWEYRGNTVGMPWECRGNTKPSYNKLGRNNTHVRKGVADLYPQNNKIQTSNGEEGKVQ